MTSRNTTQPILVTTQRSVTQQSTAMSTSSTAPPIAASSTSVVDTVTSIEPTSTSIIPIIITIVITANPTTSPTAIPIASIAHPTSSIPPSSIPTTSIQIFTPSIEPTVVVSIVRSVPPPLISSILATVASAATISSSGTPAATASADAATASSSSNTVLTTWLVVAILLVFFSVLAIYVFRTYKFNNFRFTRRKTREQQLKDAFNTASGPVIATLDNSRSRYTSGVSSNNTELPTRYTSGISTSNLQPIYPGLPLNTMEIQPLYNSAPLFDQNQIQANPEIRYLSANRGNPVQFVPIYENHPNSTQPSIVRYTPIEMGNISAGYSTTSGNTNVDTGLSDNTADWLKQRELWGTVGILGRLSSGYVPTTNNDSNMHNPFTLSAINEPLLGEHRDESVDLRVYCADEDQSIMNGAFEANQGDVNEVEEPAESGHNENTTDAGDNVEEDAHAVSTDAASPIVVEHTSESHDDVKMSNQNDSEGNMT